MRSQHLLLLVFTGSLLSSAQRIGPCPTSTARSPEQIKELRGVVVDETLAVVPKVKVRLQVPDGVGKFRDLGATQTDSAGRFDFAAQRSENYRLVFEGSSGFCPATIPIRYSKTGLKGIRLVLPAAASDTCPDYCESRLKVEEMTDREGHE